MPTRRTFAQSRLAASGRAKDLRAVAAQHNGLCVAVDGGDVHAAGTFHVLSKIKKRHMGVRNEGAQK